MEVHICRITKIGFITKARFKQNQNEQIITIRHPNHRQ